MVRPFSSGLHDHPPVTAKSASTDFEVGMALTGTFSPVRAMRITVRANPSNTCEVVLAVSGGAHGFRFTTHSRRSSRLLMYAFVIASWMCAGIVTGAGLAVYSAHLLTVVPRRFFLAGAATSLLTSCVFGGLASYFGHQFALLPYSVLAAVGVALGLIDVLEQRLPSVLIYFGLTVIVVLFAASAILQSHGPDLLRALAGMAITGAFYLILALASRGGLGAGDVKLGALVGLALAWSSWSVLVTGTFLGWLAAGLGWIALRVVRRSSSDALLPMGPFLVLGALLAVIVMPR
jgi:leader peptidase (prepilin peptidase) / N-methyltransferase